MTINPILAMITVVIFIFGVFGSAVVNVLFFVRLKKACPEIYKTNSVVWKDSKIIQEAIVNIDDESLRRLYKLSRQVPAISAIAFGIFVLIIIVTAR